MYRIELAPGEEAALRTVDELATGIRNGVITPRARIWHNAGQKWLPIEFHPHYQAALKQLEGDPADEPAAAPAIAVERREPASMAPMPAATAIAPQPQPVAAAAAPAPAPTVVEPKASETAAPIVSSSAPAARRPFAIARPIGLIVGGIVLIVGAQVVASATDADVPGNNVAQMAATVPAVSPKPRVALDPTPRPTPTAAPAIDTALASATPYVEPSTRAPGGAVVRGPSPTSSAPPPPSSAAPKPEDENEDKDENEDQPLPTLAPAPAVTGLPAPPAVDNLN